jgi:polyhydroxybutyrate depolymerase
MRPLALVGVVALAACSSSPPPPPSPLITARPYDIDIPTGWHNDKPLPLVILLHGYGTTGFAQRAYFGFNHLPDDRHVLVAYPDGTVNSHQAHFWNADDACCNLDNSPVDDVAYLNAVIDDVEAHWKVDQHHVFFVGHSNGGFMSHRMACDAAARIAGIVALAGDVWKDPSRCNPSVPVPVLQVHGDADDTVPYDGRGAMPAARDSVGTWATKNHCSGALTPTGRTLDLDSTIPGPETEVAAWSCPAGVAAELWTLHGGSHMPQLIEPDWGNDVVDWLMQYSR